MKLTLTRYIHYMSKLVPEVYDIETISNLFTYVSYLPDSDEWFEFVIHRSQNDSEKLYNHLTRQGFFQVGFNNNNFDYPVLHHFIRHWNEYKYLDGEELATKLYKKAQDLINSSEFREISDKNKFIIQIDLFQIWHYNNKARRTSLKDLEFAMRMENLQEMPISHEQYCTSSNIPLVLSYNKNDVFATNKFYQTTLGKTDYPIYIGRNKMELRKQFKIIFDIPCYNWPDVKIGEQLLLTLYSRAVNANPFDIKKLKTYRDKICLKDCIPYWCNIKSKEFKKFLDILNNTTIIPGSKDFSKTIYFHGIGFDFGLGGSHGCIKSGIYESKDGFIILDLDISSLYPSIAKSLCLYPEHLGKSFNKLYTQFIKVRIDEKHKPKAERNNALIEGYKLLLNGTYGKSGEETSFLYDPLYTYKTTIAGQCFICMWAEQMVEVCPELEFIQINTDGITIRLPENKINNIKEVCIKLEELTGLQSEFSYYKQMIIRDVNNYAAVYDDSTKENEHIKLKGCFEIYKEFHKDSSMSIVPIALKNYYIYNIPVEETIKNHKDIFDFCIRLKINSSSKAYFNYLKNFQRISEPLSRTTRYFASNNGGSITVYYNGSKRVTQLNKGKQFTLFNSYFKSDNYNIDYSFYIAETYKIINAIDDGQLTLF